MASASHLMKRMNLSTGKHGVTGVLLDGAVGFAASYGIGQVYHRKNDKWYGKNAARIAAVAGKLGAVALAAYSGSPGLAVGVANSVGQAGLNAIGLEMGLRHARSPKRLMKSLMHVSPAESLQPSSVSVFLVALAAICSDTTMYCSASAGGTSWTSVLLLNPLTTVSVGNAAA